MNIKQIATATTSELETRYAELDGHDCNAEDYCDGCAEWERVERELDARELWNSDDARVRESVGNYR